VSRTFSPVPTGCRELPHDLVVDGPFPVGQVRVRPGRPGADERHQGGRWLVAPYGEVAWVRNVRAAGEVELRRARTTERCLAREATAEEAVPVLRTYLRQVRIVRPYFDVTLSSPDAAFAAEAPRHPVFLLTSPSS
jgi:hypothetical protein